jgi:glutamate--cysteine ligase
MPGPVARLTPRQARDHIEEQCFAPTGDAQVGLECEWHVFRTDEPYAVAGVAEVQDCVGQPARLPAHSAVTFEPGGQLELSTPPGPDVAGACASLERDEHEVRARLAAAGLQLVALGMDPLREPARLVTDGRYRAMEEYFDGHGEHGRWMMSRTAAIQINLDNGRGASAERRWQLAHQIAPALIAAFANSPFRAGRRSGWKSTRLANWLAMDPSRTAPVGADSGRSTWIDYALGARVMLIRTGEHGFVPLDRPVSFVDWMVDGHELGYPTIDDLDYHLTTLFPPVRPRGWLELRYLDALPDPFWRVATAVVTALLYDDDASADLDWLPPTSTRQWRDASRHGLAHPGLQRTAARLFSVAIEGLARVGTDRLTHESCVAFADRYVARGRCPADDLMDATDLKEPPWI